MLWLNYYNDYSAMLSEFNDMERPVTDSDFLCEKYIEVFNSACNLLKVFLNYNGLFQFENREIIKEAFSVGLILDGERWINALSLNEIYETGDFEEFKPLILSYCEPENFYIFNDLKKIFDMIKEDYV